MRWHRGVIAQFLAQEDHGPRYDGYESTHLNRAVALERTLADAGFAITRYPTPIIRCTKCGEMIDDGRPVIFHESGVQCGLLSDCYQRGHGLKAEIDASGNVQERK